MSGSYHSFIEQELQAERDRRTTLDARAQGVITTSGAFVSLAGAIGAFISSRDGYELPVPARFALAAVVALLAGAGLLAIIATLSFKYRVAAVASLSAMPRERWVDDPDIAARSVAAMNVDTIATLRAGNSKKSYLLVLSLLTQLLGVASLGAAVYLMMILG